jgi:hypothetical protein
MFAELKQYSVRLYSLLCLSGVHVSLVLLLIIYVNLYTGVQHEFYIIYRSCRLTVRRRVSLVEYELLSEFTPVFSGIHVV